MTDLRDKVALVTGASRGVGRGIAHELGVAGATVYVTGRSVSDDSTIEDLGGNIHSTAELVTEAGGTGIAVRCDHTIDSEVEAVFERIRIEHGRLDILVNNVWGGYEDFNAANFAAPFWEQPLWRWQLMFDAGVRAHYTASRLAAALMIPRKQGLIVNISSGDEGKFRGQVLYDIAKAAVDRMAFGMALELRQHSIAAIVIYPGLTRTERVKQFASEDELASSESPRYAGRAVVALATDPDVMRRSGSTYKTGQLALEYGFTDVDGTQPPPFVFGM